MWKSQTHMYCTFECQEMENVTSRWDEKIVIFLSGSRKWQYDDCAGNGKSDGSEDEQASVEQNEHAERNPTDEQAEAS